MLAPLTVDLTDAAVRPWSSVDFYTVDNIPVPPHKILEVDVQGNVLQYVLI